MKKVSKNKLLQLATFLEKKVSSKKFNIRHYFTKGFTVNECGSTACALGWATRCFPDLRLVRINGISSVVTSSYPIDKTTVSWDENGEFLPVFYYSSERPSEISIREGAKFFGISVAVCSYLFLPDSYWSPLMGTRLEVIRRIREICNFTPSQLNKVLRRHHLFGVN